MVFGGASEIYTYVPDICELALRRKIELHSGEDLECEESFNSLKAAITQWEGGGFDDSHQDPNFIRGRLAAEIVSQNALFLFLMSSYLQDRAEDQAYLREISQPLVDRMIEMLPILRETSFASLCFWPIIVTASYALTETQRKAIVSYLPPFMPIIVRATELLRWIWENPEEMFGLSGMAKVIELHHTSYCFG